MTTLDDVLQQLADMSQTTREKGDYFERLILRVLKLSPWYHGQFSNVWMWKDWPGRNGKVDAGIDLVAERADDGGIVAIQCKFYDPDHYLDKGQLDSFFASMGADGVVFGETA